MSLWIPEPRRIHRLPAVSAIGQSRGSYFFMLSNCHFHAVWHNSCIQRPLHSPGLVQIMDRRSRTWSQQGVRQPDKNISNQLLRTFCSWVLRHENDFTSFSAHFSTRDQVYPVALAKHQGHPALFAEFWVHLGHI